MDESQIYAIGQQDFSVLREDGAPYVDKTTFIEKLVRSNTKYYFLARPRRFGKSLFLSTLRYFFEGKRELFKGLYIDSFDWDWAPYPVIYIDLNRERYAEEGKLDDVLVKIFSGLEMKYGVEVKDSNLSQRFETIIETAHEKTGKQVVILVDEYDKPLVGNLNKDDNFEHYRRKLASLYSNFKSSAEHIRLVFLTGVSRFSKLSVFSDLNNLKDISFDNRFADICGITEKELVDYFHQGIKLIGEKRGINFEEACRLLKENYDGYRFSPTGSDIYNPWSVLNAMSESMIRNYWNSTGKATLIAETLRNANVDIESILNANWNLDLLSGLDLRNADPTALLYQTGYLTIGEYEWDDNTVRLKVPNKEVKQGLFYELLPLYVKVKQGFVERVVDNLLYSIRAGKPEELMKDLETYFAGIPYDLKIENENNFHNAFYILATLIGIDAKAEVHTSDGRIDMMIESRKYIYIIELKYDHSPEEALRQIEEKEYGLKYANDLRQLFKIGVSFSSKTRRISGWKIVSSQF
ncbi:MAG: ATP-binding protein [Muribaculaceae bacterium]|nr:ATP-binding protein [Muribaculaceae bacterium]